LSYEQISGTGKYKILLTETQKEKLDESKKLEKGLILELKHEQLKANYSGGFLPIIFAALGALGGLAGGAAAVTNGVINAKHQRAEEEMISHNSEMEKIAESKQALSIAGSGFKKV
jgi:energy-converting hydrogenase Eha subunit G